MLLGGINIAGVDSQVKIKARGMFNYRLKWRCKFPLDGVRFRVHFV